MYNVYNSFSSTSENLTYRCTFLNHWSVKYHMQFLLLCLQEMANKILLLLLEYSNQQAY